ncbi:MAG: hypothetical protein CM15mP66_01410 [Pseudomonadota bacterium]|nr:MAG: hypothetical protein CM15mP66_01410 [Pseudomonadota bacterium]
MRNKGKMLISEFFLKRFFCFLILFTSFPFLVYSQAVPDRVTITARGPLQVSEVRVKLGDSVLSGDILAVMKRADGSKLTLRAGVSGRITEWKMEPYRSFKDGEILGVLQVQPLIIETNSQKKSEFQDPSLGVMFEQMQDSTGLARIIRGQEMDWSEGIGRVLMMLIGFILLYLGIQKKFEPLLLVPIGFGTILTNIPGAGLSEPGGLLYYVYEMGITTGIFPLLIFMGIGAMTDFGPMLANPRTALLGGAAQFGIFATLLGALALNWVPGIDFSLRDAASIGIIGGAEVQRDFPFQSTVSKVVGFDSDCRVFIHGFGSPDSTSDHETADNGKGTENGNAAVTLCVTPGEDHVPFAGSDSMWLVAPIRSTLDRYVHAGKSCS